MPGGGPIHRQHLAPILSNNIGGGGRDELGNQSPASPKTIGTERPVISIAACQKQLKAAETFYRQTMGRIDGMKKAVLRADLSVKCLHTDQKIKAKGRVSQSEGTFLRFLLSAPPSLQFASPAPSGSFPCVDLGN